jgi:pyrroline-5-carboxylate reductase
MLNGDCMVIAVVGAGVIGNAIAKALVQNVAADKIVASDNRVEQLIELKKVGVETTTDNKKAVATADMIILCVKPKDIKSVLAGIRNEIREKLVLSMAAGVNLLLLQKAAPGVRFVRVMPNLAILVREAFIGYCVGANVTSKDKDIIKKILGIMGTCIEVDEDKMDAITALSGCAPAILVSLLEAMVEGGIEVGLPPDLALAASAQSMVGTGKLLLEAKKSLSEITTMVATPGGVTEEELKELAKFPLHKAFISALQTGTKKSKRITQILATEDQ